MESTLDEKDEDFKKRDEAFRRQFADCYMILVCAAGEKRINVGRWKIFQPYFQPGEQLSPEAALAKIDSVLSSIPADGPVGEIHGDVQLQHLSYARGLIEGWVSRGEVEQAALSTVAFVEAERDHA